MGRLVGGRLGREVADVCRLSGRNSRVYRVTCTSGETYAVKLYLRRRPDERDRLAAEFAGLNFLWDHGVRCVPRPLIALPEANLAVYDYVEGAAIGPGSASGQDIDQAVEFLGVLEALKERPGATDLPSAAEACFSFQAIVESIEERLRRLQRAQPDDRAAVGFRAFVADALPSALRTVAAWSASRARTFGFAFAAPIDLAARTLSPSDFGFHNALRARGGSLVFLDFEYFGWDDPAKMVADFLLHPAMRLSEDLKHRFVVGVLRRLSRHPGLDRRVEIVYPLLGLKWCVILLNEFLPEHLARRGFAEDEGPDAGQAQAEQLDKACTLLDRVMSGHERFAYGY